MMISKELLSEVYFECIPYLEDINTIELHNGTEVHYGKYSSNHINIYELANKCKEWANKGNIAIASFQGFNSAIATVYEGTSLNMFELTEIEADTEPEAIFKACEWILETVSTDTKIQR